MEGRDPVEVLVGRVRPHALDERAHLPRPLLQIGAEDRELLFVGYLRGGELLGPAALAQAPLPAHANVPHPLGLATRRDEIAAARAESGDPRP